MNQKNLIISILSAFILTISSLTISVNFTEAQVPDVGLPTCVPAPGIPCPVQSAQTPEMTSPHSVCQYYANRPEKGLFSVETNLDEECLVKVGDENIGFGYIRGYYSGNQFCLSRYGAYFNNASYRDSTSCKDVPQINKVQPQKTSPKIPTQVKPLKKPDAGNSQAFNDLLNVSNLSNTINNAVNLATENLRSFFNSIFNDVKKFFQKIKP